MSRAGETCSNCIFSKMKRLPDNSLLLICAKCVPLSVAQCLMTPNGPQWAAYVGWPNVHKDDWCGEWKPQLNS